MPKVIFKAEKIKVSFGSRALPLIGYDKESGKKVYEEEYGYDIHPKTEFIIEKNNIYFQTSDGDTIHLRVNL